MCIVTGEEVEKSRTIAEGKRMQQHFEISYLTLRVSLIALQRAELPPYLGSTLRGAIGQALLQTDKDACAFLYRNGESTDINKGQVIVKPYMIIPPEICTPQTVIEQGESIAFEFLLFGNASEYVLSLILALEQIHRFGLGARRYPFYLSEIINSRTQRIIWRQGNRLMSDMNAAVLPYYELPDVTGVVIKICTLLRIRHGGQLRKNLSFQTLIRNITNRVISIAERYGGWVDRTEVERIQSLAAEVQTVREELRVERMERYSNRINRKMDFSGLAGEVEYEGNLSPFVPWLTAAQRLHVGRNTTFGMGKIEVYFI